MRKKAIGMTLALMLLCGSCLTVCAEEAAPESAPQQVQNYQPVMTPEILASYEGGLDNMDDTTLCNALVRRTDVWGELQDADGDGIDDRDPINGCGYLDLNYNGFDDRFEMAVVAEVLQEDAQEGYAVMFMFNLLSHRCKHGIVYSNFMYEEGLNTYWSWPDYFDKCPECADSFDDMLDEALKVLDQLDQLDY